MSKSKFTCCNMECTSHLL